jgi:dolichol-phosphate mannosyltransferase
MSGPDRVAFILPGGRPGRRAAVPEIFRSGTRSLTANHEPSLAGGLDVSVVVPVCNEEDNVQPLAQEIHAALQGRYAFETIFVDDGSTDTTARAVLMAKGRGMPEIRLIRHAVRSGQSAAVATGVREAHAPWIATLDGDGQNDPADIPRLLAAMQGGGPKLRLVMGNRTARRDTWLRRLSSRIANGVRGWFLRDGTPDTGCGVKVFDRGVFLDVPRFRNMHRFLPALYQREGYQVISVPVNHRERTTGQSKYGLHDRLWVGIVDLWGLRWLIKRASPRVAITEET